MTKQRKFIFWLVLLSATIILPYSFFLYRNYSSKEVKIVLELMPNKDSLKHISKNSLDSLESIIRKSNKYINNETLISTFEREREHYLVLLAILSILLTFSIAYTIINRFVEKSDLDKQKKRLKKLEKELIFEIEEVKANSICSEYNSFINSLYDGETRFMFTKDRSGKIVMNFDDFIKYIKSKSEKLIDLLNKMKPDDNPLRYVLMIKNLFNGAEFYCQHNRYVTQVNQGNTIPPLRKALLDFFEDSLYKDIYSNIINELKKMEPDTFKDI